MGGGGKGGTTTQSVQIPPEVLARYNAVNTRAEGVAGTPFQPYSNDPNAFVAPLSPTQEAGIANTNQAAGMAQPYYDTASKMTMAGSQSVGQLTPDQINKYQNPYTQAVADTTFGNLRQQQAQEMQGATGNAIRSGAFGGDRSGLVAANLARQQQQGTAAAMAPMYQQGYQNAVQTAQGQQAVTAADLARLQQGGQQIAGYGSGAQGAALQGAGAQLAAGQTQQQTAQAGKAALYNQFLQQQGYPFQIAQFLANIAEGTGALSGSTTSTTQPGGFFSDERLKENIKKIGETNDGQPIYKYNYKGEPRTQIGLLAQEVEKHHPDAVGKQQGYKTVDYDKATENSEGGAVHQFNAREGFDLGGSAAFDPNMVKELLRRQVEMYQQQGAPGGNKAPGTAGYMPATPALPSNISIARPAAPPQQQASGLAQAANTARGITEGLGMAEGAKNKLFGGTDAKGNKVEGWFSGDSAKEGVDKNATLTDQQKADAEEARKKGIKTTEVDKAHGGLITGPRMGYAMGGLPYGDEEATKKGYMGALSYDMPSPAALKKEQDDMRNGKLPDAPQSGLGEAAGAASKLYSGTKMASAAYDKAADMLSGATPAGELATKYPAAPAGTPMPAARPEGLGGASPNPLADAPSAGANPVSANLPANTAEGFHIPMGTAPVAEAAPVAEGLGVAATPAAETAAGLGAAGAEGLGAAGLGAGAAEAGTAALGAGAAEAGVSIAELLPLLLLKRGGVAEREHHAGEEGNVVGESATPEFDRLKKQRLEAEAAATAAPVEAPAPASAPVKANIFEGLNPSSRAAVNNNPGNLEASSWAQKQPGYVGTDGRFAKFESPEHGETAMHNLLTDYQKRGFNTPSSIIGRWAPPSDNNDTASYVAQVAKKLGVGPNDPIDVSDPNVRSILGKAIATVEAGSAQSGAGKKASAPSQPAAEKSGLGAVKESLSDAGNYYTKNREHIIPVIAGLGSMLASNKANLGQALGEGLVGYSTSAADMMKRQADVENTRQSTNTMMNQDVRASLVTVGGINGVFIKGGKFIPFDEYEKMPNKPDLLGYKPSEGSEEYKAAQAEMESRKSGQPTTAQPSTGLAATPAPLPSQIDDQSLKLAQEAKGEFNRGTNQSAAAREATKNYGNATQARGYTASQNQNQILELAELINKAGQQTGLGVPGSLYGPRMELLRGVNTIAGGLSAPPVSEAPQIAKQINKITTNLTDVGSPETLGQFRENKAALASGELDPDSAANVMADLMVRNRMAIDQDEHKEAFRQYSGGNLAPAQRDFDRKYSVARQDVEKRAIAELIKTNPDNLLQKLRDMPAAEIDKLFSKKDPRLVNMSRYFVGRQQ